MAALISLPTSALLVLLSFLVSFYVCSISCAVGPLDPWIVPNATMPWITDSSLPGHHCINIKTSIYGLCSNLNHVWWAITMARSLSAHEIAIYLDHKVSTGVKCYMFGNRWMVSIRGSLWCPSFNLVIDPVSYHSNLALNPRQILQLSSNPPT